MLSVPVWGFQLKLDKGVKGCECKSRYAWQTVVSANVYDAACDFDHEREVEGCERSQKGNLD